MKALFVSAILSLCLLGNADIIPPNVHYISQKGIIDNLDTLEGALCTIQMCSSGGTGYCSTPSAVKPDSFFPVSGPTNRYAWNVIRICLPPLMDTTVISFTANDRLVSDTSPLISEEYHYRLYHDWQGKVCLAKVKLISTFNNGKPPAIQTFPLPDIAEHSTVRTAAPPLLKCDATMISFQFTRPQSATLQITDISGRVVKTLKTAVTSEGRLPFPKVSAGTYFVKLDAQDGSVSQQVTVPR